MAVAIDVINKLFTIFNKKIERKIKFQIKKIFMDLTAAFAQIQN